MLLAVWAGPTSAALAQNDQNRATPDHAVVLGFDRFFAKSKDDLARGGHILLSELNCVACHQADQWPLKKQAPVLDGIGGRVRASYLQAFLADPQSAKPGTTMPNLLASLPEQARKDSVNALVHFLASTGSVTDNRPVAKLIARGKKLFNQVGCAACHGPRDTRLKDEATVLPLGELSRKYSIVSLAGFLQDPHKTRPSGRMPSLNLKPGEAQEIAHYLLADLAVAEAGVNMNYAYYELNEEPINLPDFAKLKPTATGQSMGCDLGYAQRNDNVAMKFDGWLVIAKEGLYTFHLMSDDGSRLWIKDRLVVDNDGIHAPVAKSGKIKLPAGKTPISVAAFNAGGGFELDVNIEGPGIGVQPLANLLAPLTATAKQVVPPKAKDKGMEPFVVDGEQAKKGRELFATLGCASCHNLKDGKANIVSKLQAPPLAKLLPGRGCLADAKETFANARGSARYALNPAQRTALAEALKAPAKTPTAKEAIEQTFTVFNCYACHQRDGVGGVEPGLNDVFMTTQKEMGDEGRLPPHLNGVGGKLTAAYLKKLLANGATDRPYMLTRMPKFGDGNVGNLQANLEAVDAVPSAPVPAFRVPEKKIKSEGRFMVGNKAFGCIKCHNFREYASSGVQGMNMTIMADRLRREWFTQYLLDPNKYRPGTRMPAVWPLGQAQLTNILDGDTAQQIEAVWRYLADGRKAALPYGVGREEIPLIAKDTPLMYRNFIQGAGPRAIGVGYPEKINLAFDANDLRYAMIWHKEFIDASRHWNGRGEGFEPPMGEGVVHLPAGPSIAILSGKDEPWPAKAQKDKGYKFRGYRFDDKLRPTFLCNLGDVHVEDTMIPVEERDSGHFRRTVTITAEKVPDNLWFRAAAAEQIKDAGNGWYAVGSDLKVRVDTPIIRSNAGKMELLIPIRGNKTTIVEELAW
jgi:mono/diheme cytochrome c family protein